MKNVIVLGIMGHGKSQLCNFLDGDLTNSKYKVGHHNNSQTQMHDLLSKDKKDLIILRNKYNLIDSCGGGEKYEKDIDNLEEYTKYLTKIGGVNCIIFVFNYTVRAENNDLSEYLRKLATIFTPKEFYERLIIVLTNFPNKPKIKDKQKRDIYKQEINDIMRKAFEIKNENLSKEIFFIDTDPYEDDNGNNKYFNEVQIKTRDAIIDEIELICNSKYIDTITTFTFTKEDLQRKKEIEKEIIKKKFEEWNNNPELFEKDKKEFLIEDSKWQNHNKNISENNINKTSSSSCGNTASHFLNGVFTILEEIPKFIAVSSIVSKCSII